MAGTHLTLLWTAAEDSVDPVVTDPIPWQQGVQALVVLLLGIVLAMVVRRGWSAPSTARATATSAWSWAASPAW